MIFLNGCLITAWSRSQKSIALSSCEAEFLASAGGAAEALQLKELWRFLSKREVFIKAITDELLQKGWLTLAQRGFGDRGESS